MARKFILSCESTVDMPYARMQERDVPVMFYHYAVDGEDYTDDMFAGEGSYEAFYAMIRAGKMPKTSQLNTYAYLEFLEGLLQKGDVLHIAFGTGMTQSAVNGAAAVKELREKYPERKLVLIDSLCSSSGYGLLVESALDLADTGAELEEVEAYVNGLRNRIHHQFYSTDMTFFRKSGRVSGPVASIATLLNICPLMRLNDAGRILAYDKVRGKKNAIRATVEVMERCAEGGTAYAGKCFLCNSDCREDAEATKALILERFPNLKAEDVQIFDIGPIIAAHTGSGTVALFFVGSERTAE